MARFQKGKLRLPKTQHVGLNPQYFGRFADLEASLGHPLQYLGGSPRGCRGLGLGTLGRGGAADLTGHGLVELPLLIRSFRTWLALKDSTRRESIVMGA